MKSMTSALLFALITLSLQVESWGQEPAKVVAQITTAAYQFIDLLDDEQKEKVSFEFTDQEQRVNWSNLPEGAVTRGGLRMGDLTDEQKAAVMKLLASFLSEEGVQQVIENMEADETLVQGGNRVRFGRDIYFISFLGTPSETKPWMIQFGGHHLAINATVVKDQVTVSPSLTGGQPMRFELDGKKIDQLDAERAVVYELLESFTAEQLEKVVVADRPAGLIWGPGREGEKPQEQGMKYSEMTEAQQQLLTKVIESRVGILNETHTKITMDTIKPSLDETWFAWFGSTKKGEAATYRIQGPRVMIEYVPQGNGSGATNHIHAIYRDPANDYGTGWINPQR